MGRRLRLGIVLVAVLVGASACEWRVSTVAHGAVSLRCEVRAPSATPLAAGPYWVPNASATVIRFTVVNAAVPGPVDVYWEPKPVSVTTTVPGYVPPHQRVWDGTATSGMALFSSMPAFAVALRTEGGAEVSGDVSWTMSALDAQGNDVGFRGCDVTHFA